MPVGEEGLVISHEFPFKGERSHARVTRTTDASSRLLAWFLLASYRNRITNRECAAFFFARNKRVVEITPAQWGKWGREDSESGERERATSFFSKIYFDRSLDLSHNHESNLLLLLLRAKFRRLFMYCLNSRGDPFASDLIATGSVKSRGLCFRYKSGTFNLIGNLTN